MRERLTFKKLICLIFGHNYEYSHTFNSRDIFICKRCGQIATFFKPCGGDLWRGFQE